MRRRLQLGENRELREANHQLQQSVRSLSDELRTSKARFESDSQAATDAREALRAQNASLMKKHQAVAEQAARLQLQLAQLTRLDNERILRGASSDGAESRAVLDGRAGSALGTSGMGASGGWDNSARPAGGRNIPGSSPAPTPVHQTAPPAATTPQWRGGGSTGSAVPAATAQSGAGARAAVMSPHSRLLDEIDRSIASVADQGRAVAHSHQAEAEQGRARWAGTSSAPHPDDATGGVAHMQADGHLHEDRFPFAGPQPRDGERDADGGAGHACGAGAEGPGGSGRAGGGEWRSVGGKASGAPLFSSLAALDRPVGRRHGPPGPGRGRSSAGGAGGEPAGGLRRSQLGSSRERDGGAVPSRSGAGRGQGGDGWLSALSPPGNARSPPSRGRRASAGGRSQDTDDDVSDAPGPAQSAGGRRPDAFGSRSRRDTAASAVAGEEEAAPSEDAASFFAKLQLLLSRADLEQLMAVLSDFNDGVIAQEEAVRRAGITLEAYGHIREEFASFLRLAAAPGPY